MLPIRTLYSRKSSCVQPTSWSGSLATECESRLRLLDQLDAGAFPTLEPALDSARDTLKRRIGAERRREAEEDTVRGGRFE